MKRVEEFQETEKLIEEYKNFGNKISEYEGKIDSNKEENAAKVNELEGQLEINNKKSAERIKKLESQLQITFSDAEFEIDRAALQDEVNKQIELEKANLAKENKEIEKTIKAEKANLVAENKKVENQIKAEKDNKKYFRTDANLKTITMEIEEMKKEVAKCKLELAKKDLELREFYAEGASQENKSKWQEIYKEQDEIKNNMNELNSKIDEYQNFKNELLSITLTPSEYKEMYAREERKDPAKAEEERKEKLWDEINQSIEQNIEGGKEETKSPTIDNSAEKKAQSEHKENGESEPDIVDEVNESIENNMKKPETKWEDISSNSTPAVEANKYCLHIERNRKNIVVNGVEFSREEVAKKREAIERTEFKGKIEWLKEHGDIDVVAAILLQQQRRVEDKNKSEQEKKSIRNELDYQLDDYAEMIENQASRRDSTVDITYELRNDGKLRDRIKEYFADRENYKALKAEALNAKYYAKVKCSKFTKLQMWLQKKRDAVSNKMLNEAETPEALPSAENRSEEENFRARIAVPTIENRQQPVQTQGRAAVENVRDNADREER